MGNERRRDYMVNQRVHLLYMVTWITSLLLVVAAVATGYALFQLAPRQPAPVVLGVNGYALVGVLVFVIVTSALGLGVYSIVHTHRMLGSAYHIGMHLSRINSGATAAPLILRDGDYFKEVADEVNQLHAKLAPSRSDSAQRAPATNAPPAPPS